MYIYIYNDDEDDDDDNDEGQGTLFNYLFPLPDKSSSCLLDSLVIRNQVSNRSGNGLQRHALS